MNSLSRFYLQPADWGESSGVLLDEEAKHCCSVLRKRAGDVVEVFDGVGRSARAELTSIDKRRCELRFVEVSQSISDDVPALSLAVAIPKGKTMDLIVQKAVELGISKIQPLLTENVVVKLNVKEAERKAEKWQRIGLEACKQCGQNFLPRVLVPKAINDWLADDGTEATCRVIASLEKEAQSFQESLKEMPIERSTACLLVGPEGDFSRVESELAFKYGFKPVTLGKIVMRVETAVFYAASVLRFAQGA